MSSINSSAVKAYVVTGIDRAFPSSEIDERCFSNGDETARYEEKPR